MGGPTPLQSLSRLYLAPPVAGGPEPSRLGGRVQGTALGVGPWPPSGEIHSREGSYGVGLPWVFPYGNPPQDGPPTLGVLCRNLLQESWEYY